jgi:hypothetical protein
MQFRSPPPLPKTALIQLPLRYLVLIQGHKKQGFWSKLGPKLRSNKERGRLPRESAFLFTESLRRDAELYFVPDWALAHLLVQKRER